MHKVQSKDDVTAERRREGEDNAIYIHKITQKQIQKETSKVQEMKLINQLNIPRFWIIK